MIVRNAKFVVDGRVGGELLDGVVSEHMAGAKRLKKLKDYYMGRTDVLKRVRSPGLPNNRINHPFARYIATVTVGYLIGRGITYKADRENEEALEELISLFRLNDISAVDVENARNAAVFGRGIEYIALDAETLTPRAYALSPESAFVVYSDDIAHKPLFGVYLTRAQDVRGETEDMGAVVATDRYIIRFESTKDGFIPVSEEMHFFGQAPIIEYWNDENETGDFEWVIGLIDAYDSLQSDRLNDKDQFADKLLVLTGCTLEDDEEGRPPWMRLRLDKALCLPDGEAKAEYLSGEMDENGNEILRKSLSDDIHRLSLVPDLSDMSFAGNLSGVAMKYKLIGLEQLTVMKQRWFGEALKSRLKIFAGYMALRGGKTLDVGKVSVSFTRALPEDLSQTASVIKAASEAGAMSTRTMVEMLHQGSDWDEEAIRNETELAKAENG